MTGSTLIDDAHHLIETLEDAIKELERRVETGTGNKTLGRTRTIKQV